MSREEDFYNLTEATINRLAKLHGVRNLSDYYSHVDFNPHNPLYSQCLSRISNNLNRAFAQYAFHAQNSMGERLSPIVKFIDNFNTIMCICQQFNPQAFCKKYSGSCDPVQDIVEDLNQNGIKWNRNSNKKKEVMYRYASRLWYGAQLFSKYKTMQEMENYYKGILKKSKDTKELVKQFLKDTSSNGRPTLGVALACDFLKEFSKDFECLGKPDVHIKDAMDALHKRKTHIEDEYSYIAELQEIVDTVNKTSNKQITVYQLDRMIWLVSTQQFFLDSTITKQNYLNDIALKCFCNVQ